MSVEIENLNKRIQLLTTENNRLYSKLKTQQRKNTRLRSALRKNGVRYAEEYDKNITTRELVVENENETNVVQEVIIDSNENSEAGSSQGDGNISDNWEDTSMEFSGN
jgi:predicted RNase H-like nuclease (RuvC/YqgF family)